MLKKMKLSGLLVALFTTAVTASFFTNVAQAADALEESFKIEKSIAIAAAASQTRIDNLADKTADMSADYKLTMQRVDNLRSYNKQYEQLIKSQEREMASIKYQMSVVDDTEKGVVPLMNDMIDKLEEFIELDIPFLLDERRKRVTKLRTNMLRADLSNSEKYRQILEAYQIENQYGDFAEAKDGKITDAGKEISVSYYRFGRVAYVYQSLDEQNAAYWDNDSRSWKPLDDSYRIPVRNGIKIARRLSNPNLVILPVPAAKPAGSAQ
jgi:hypothetical protein